MSSRKFNEDEIRAFACAVAVLEGTAGGYSTTEKSNAKNTLLSMYAEGVRGSSAGETHISEGPHRVGE